MKNPYAGLKRKFAAITGSLAMLGALQAGKKVPYTKALPTSVLMKAGRRVVAKKKKRVRASTNHGLVGKKSYRYRKKTFRGRRSKMARSLTKTVRKALQEQQESISIYRKSRFGELRLKDILLGAGVRGVINNFTKINTTALGPTSNQYEFSYFNQLKLADAISVCYKGKSTGGDWTDATGNFGNNLKTRVVYAAAKCVMKNHTQYAFDVNIHIFTCRNNNNTSPLQSYKTQKAANTNISGDYTEVFNGIRMEFGARLEDIDLPDYTRKTVRYKNVIPGQELTWYDSIKDYHYDQQKLIQGSSAETVRFSKGCKVLLIEFVPVINSVFGSIGGAPNKYTSTRGHPNLSGDPQPTANFWGFEETEYYKVVQPEITDDAHEGHKVKLFTDTDLKGMEPSSLFQKALTLPNTIYGSGGLAP